MSEQETNLEFELFVPGSPHPQPRPSVTRQGRVYYRDPQKKLAAWSKSLDAAWDHYRRMGWSPTETIACAVTVKLQFTLERPKAHGTKGHNLSALGKRTPLPVGPRCDVDNLAKCVLDWMVSRAILRDDGLVVMLTASKSWAYVRFSDPPGCHIAVHSIQ